MSATERLQRARATVATIEGWLTDDEGEFLFRLASGCPPGAPIVEIGSWKGKSTVWLASGVGDPELTKVYAIDPHEQSLEDPSATTLKALEDNLMRSGVAGAVVPIVSASHIAAKTFHLRPGVVFIDGSHLEDGVRIDVNDWFPKLAEGGVLALHDVINHRWSGPRRALRSLLWHSREVTSVRFVDSIAWMRKVRGNSAGDRMRNRLVALLLVVYEINGLPLPAPVAGLVRWCYRLTPLKRSGSLNAEP